MGWSIPRTGCSERGRDDQRHGGAGTGAGAGAHGGDRDGPVGRGPDDRDPRARGSGLRGAQQLSADALGSADGHLDRRRADRGGRRDAHARLLRPRADRGGRPIADALAGGLRAGLPRLRRRRAGVALQPDPAAPPAGPGRGPGHRHRARARRAAGGARPRRPGDRHDRADPARVEGRTGTALRRRARAGPVGDGAVVFLQARHAAWRGHGAGLPVPEESLLGGRPARA